MQTEDLLIIVQKCKLKWYGHVSRSSGPAKTLSRHSQREKKKRQAEKKRWGDNIREWTGLEFAKSQRAVENREKWRELVVKSFVVLAVKG